MSIVEFTASNIAMDMDEKDKSKAGTVDMAKLTADISAQKDLALKASMTLCIKDICIVVDKEV